MSPLISFGKIFMIMGLSLVVIGGLIYLLGKLGVSHLPGTLKIDLPGGQCIVPVLASIALSILLTIVLNLIFHFLNR